MTASTLGPVRARILQLDPTNLDFLEPVAMAILQECPPPTMLLGHAHDDLDAESSTHLDWHLRECSPCRDEYLRLLGQQLLVPHVPDCHVVKEIGRGRFGVVYKAWWMQDPPRLVALKVLSSLGDMERNRFDREIAVLKKLDSPWIVRCLDSGGEGDSMYYIMDYVVGLHLDEFMKAPDRSLDEKLAVFEFICRAVADAHAHSVIHRDLKPRNILIDAEGLPHILDFGICSVGTPDWSSWSRNTITAPGDLIGTLRYMSPEQAWGGVTDPIDTRSDLWALGIILHEIITDGGYPYSLEPMADKSAHEALLERIRKDIPRKPHLDHLPHGRDLEVLLERCLAWEPDRRIASAAALADDIAAIRAGKPIRTRSLSWPYRVRRLAVGAATRSRGTFSTAFVALVGLILAVTTHLGGIGWRADLRGGASPIGFTKTADAREAFVIVGVQNDTPAAIVEFAQRTGISGVTPQATSWRGVHAHLLRRLADAEPRMIVWDYYFQSEQSADVELAEAILGLEQNGVPVVLAARDYSDENIPQLSLTLRKALGDRLRHGLIRARDMVGRPGEFVLATCRQDGSVVPSLSIIALGALIHPAARVAVDWPNAWYDRWLTLNYEISPGNYLRERDRVELTRAVTGQESEDALRLGDIIGCVSVDLQLPARWEQRTVPYEQFLVIPKEELHTIANGKVLLIGDLRTSIFGIAADRHPVKYGTRVVPDVPGCYLLADAIAGIISDRFIRIPHALQTRTLVVLLAFAAIGCAAPIRLAKVRALDQPRARRRLYFGVALSAAICFSIAITVKHALVVHVAMAGFALLMPMIGSFWVEFARNRHRIAERNRRSLENFGLESAGTVTLLQRPLRSLSGIR